MFTSTHVRTFCVFFNRVKFSQDMASRVRNEDWKEDADLIDDLAKYVSQNLYKREILNLVEVRYPQYAWSMRTLTRRLQHFDIK